MKIKVIVKGFKLEGELNSSNTAKIIYESLPIVGVAKRWGDEVYFNIPLHIEPEKDFARDVVDKGDLGFWPDGDCFCIFFGRTPISDGDKIKPASAVSVFGKITHNLELLRMVKDGDNIVVERLD